MEKNNVPSVFANTPSPAPGFPRVSQGSPQATQVVQGRQGRRVAFTQQSHAALQDLWTKLPRSTAARGFLMFLTCFNYCYAVEAVKNGVSTTDSL